MIVDCHAHFAPEVMFQKLGKAANKFPNIQLLAQDGKYRLAFAGGQPTRPVMPRLRETEERFDWMDREKLDFQVCGGWLDAFGYELPPAEGEAWARFTNEALLETVNNEKRLFPLATVPLQDGERAARVLEDAMKDGARGVMIGTQPEGVGLGKAAGLDDDHLKPFWAAASDLEAAVFIHPEYDTLDQRVTAYDMVNAVARINDLTTGVARIVFGGVLSKNPGAKVVVATGGAALPYALGRMMRHHSLHPDAMADPKKEFSHLYFDTIVFEPETLDYLVSKVGPDKIMLGSDWPFPIGDFEPRKVVEAAKLSETDRAGILGGNAARIFGLEI
ncbi:MAG: amidohydrolase family protein [Rhodospirillales bacterium]|jgi:aminocarboxymuconate-semialdehyde decarboxylase